jgi:hypothetical protein
MRAIDLKQSGLFVAKDPTKDLGNSLTNYWIVLITVLVSGNPAVFFGVQKIVLVSVALLFGFLMVNRRMPILTYRFLFVTWAFSLIFLCQSFLSGSFFWTAMLGFLVALFTGYAAVRLAAKKFAFNYINVMFHLSLLSLAFYFPAQIFHAIGLDFKSFFEFMRADLPGYFHIYVHNFRVNPSEYANIDEEWRNAGVFWEPGALSGYLLVAMILLSFTNNQFSGKEYRKRLIVLFLCLLTTFSTAGYILLPLVILFFYTDKIQAYKKYGVFACVVIAIPLVMQLPFMGEKISNEIDSARMQDKNYGMSRLGGLVFDWSYIQEKPILGWGANQQARVISDPNIKDVIAAQGNGLTGFIIRFGLAGLAVILFFFWRGLNALTGNILKSAQVILVLMLILFDEQFLNYPIFLSIMFLMPQKTGWRIIEKGEKKLLSCNKRTARNEC